MNDFNGLTTSRRNFLKTTSLIAATGSLALSRGVHATENNETIRIGLIGCGGRGTGAAVNCMNAGPKRQACSYWRSIQRKGNCFTWATRKKPMESKFRSTTITSSLDLMPIRK